MTHRQERDPQEGLQLLGTGLPPEILDLPPFEQKISKNVQFYVILGKIFYFYPFFGCFWPKLRNFYPNFKNTEFWKKSVYRLIFGIPTTVAALLVGKNFRAKGGPYVEWI